MVTILLNYKQTTTKNYKVNCEVKLAVDLVTRLCELYSQDTIVTLTLHRPSYRLSYSEITLNASLFLSSSSYSQLIAVGSEMMLINLWL